MRALYLAALFAAMAATVGFGMPADQLQAGQQPPAIRNGKKLLRVAALAAKNLEAEKSVSLSSSFALPHLKGPIPSYPDNYYNYMPIGDDYGSNFFYKIESTVPTTQRNKAPLVMWLQGGPGASSLFGAYAETGSKLYKADKKSATGYTFENNEFTWTKYATMLYVDNPIGTGFSFTNNIKGFSVTDEGIAANLVTFMRNFLVRHPEYVANEFWIFSESYGGKMAAFFGNALGNEVLVKKSFPGGFKIGGVALGDGWVGPVGCMESYSDYLFAMGQMTDEQKKVSDNYAKQAAAALSKNDGTGATNLWSQQQTFIGMATNNLNWYNSLTTFSYIPEDQLDNWLLTTFPTLPEVTQYVNITSTYSAQSNTVFSQLQNAFMRDGVAQVDGMLSLGMSVSVYVGEVDLIVDPICVRNWVNKLSWKGLDTFKTKTLTPFTSSAFAYPDQVLATRQQYDNLQLWTVSTAGHMVPADSPLGAEIMFTSIIGASSSSDDVQLGQMTAEKLFAREHQKKLNAKKINPAKRWLP